MTRTAILEDNWVEFLRYVKAFNAEALSRNSDETTDDEYIYEKSPEEVVFWIWFIEHKLEGLGE